MGENKDSKNLYHTGRIWGHSAENELGFTRTYVASI
jgi:hypothetical protein